MAPAGTDFLTIQLTAVTGAVDGTISTMFVDNVIIDTPVAADQTTFSNVKALFR
jgi:hypothetical protein